MDRGEGRRLTRRRSRSRFDEARLQRFDQQAGSVTFSIWMIWRMRNYARFQDKIEVSRAISVIKDLTFYRPVLGRC